MNDKFKALSDQQILALTIYGEARGESTQGRCAVGSVILERVKRGGWFGKTIPTVCLLPFQFSCYLPNDPNYKKLYAIASDWDYFVGIDNALKECSDIAGALINGRIQPNIIATHYKTLNCAASWAGQMRKVGVIGHHEFFI
jgi:N-acetylmuramoyl-L-alanine amidase